MPDRREDGQDHPDHSRLPTHMELPPGLVTGWIPTGLHACRCREAAGIVGYECRWQQEAISHARFAGDRS